MSRFPYCTGRTPHEVARGPTVAHSKRYLSILCPWKLEDLEYDGYCGHLPLIDLTASSIHFQEAIKLTPEELAEKAEQKGIRNEGKAIRAAERATLKALADQKRARIAAEKQAPSTSFGYGERATGNLAAASIGSIRIEGPEIPKHHFHNPHLMS